MRHVCLNKVLYWFIVLYIFNFCNKLSMNIGNFVTETIGDTDKP